MAALGDVGIEIGELLASERIVACRGEPKVVPSICEGAWKVLPEL
jgi:hypothetical protein